jgi:hypothetical protein
MKIIQFPDRSVLDKRRLLVLDGIERTVSTFGFIQKIGLGVSIGLPGYYKNPAILKMVEGKVRDSFVEDLLACVNIETLAVSFLVDTENEKTGQELNTWLEGIYPHSEIFHNTSATLVQVPLFGGVAFFCRGADSFQEVIEVLLDNYPPWREYQAQWQKIKLDEHTANRMGQTPSKKPSMDAL